jgi:carboxyl-terminal processing protease
MSVIITLRVLISIVAVHMCVSWKQSLSRNIRNTLVVLGSSLALNQQQAHAEDLSYWNDRNRLAAEIWRAVDENYNDRTFNNQDWFKLRKELVKKEYDTDEEVYSAISKMLSKLGDKYTRFLPPAAYNALFNSAAGELTGVGLELLGKDNGDVQVSNIADGSPAAFLGSVLPGDIIMNVDGSSTIGLSPEEVASLIRGKEGTKATLELARFVNGASETIDVEIVRKPFKLKGVTWSKETINGKSTGLIAIKSFSTTTRDDVLKALETIESDNLDTLVLDMRNNGGGLLEGAIETANLFLPPGKVVVFVVNKDGNTDAKMTIGDQIPSANQYLPDLKTKMFVLVNGNTASAAEVLSGVLKDQGRGTVIGQQTFGKGVIQNLQELRQGGIAITIARYETPSHVSINKIGIPVDKTLTEEECSSSDSTSTCARKFI